MMNTLSQLQLLSGQGQCLLANPKPLPNRKPWARNNLYRWYHLGRGWILLLWDFLYTIKSKLILSVAWTPPVVRERDETIIDAISERCSPSAFTLDMANSLRIYLKVITVACHKDLA